MATDEIRIGTMATLVGPFAAIGEDGIRGFELALHEFGSNIAGKRVVWFKEGTNAIPDSAVQAADILLHQKKVDFIIGPLSGNEGMAIREYAKGHPDRAFMNGAAGAQDMTLRDPAPNFYSFLTNGVQWMYGLGRYAYETLGYRRMVTLGEAYSFPYAQIGGFIVEYCRVGGRVPQKYWVGLGNTDYRAVIQSMPKNVDAIFVALGGADAVNFLEQYYTLGGRLPIVGGSLLVGEAVLTVRADLVPRVVGMVSGSPIADSNPDPAWQKFVAAYRRQFPAASPTPSLLAFGYYVNTKAALLALQQVHGDLSNGQAKFKAALQNLEFECPTGMVRLDHNRNAIANTFITQLQRREDGTLYNKIVQTMPAVNQTLGIPEEEYLKMKPFDQHNPECRY